MVENIDAVLLSVISMAEGDPAIETDITIVVAGYLISGVVVSFDVYRKHHAVPDRVFEALSTLRAQAQAGNDADMAERLEDRDFLHMRDAKYFMPGGNPIPGNANIFCRIALGSIAAYTFGKLSVAN
jgi:hypothetical protein